MWGLGMMRILLRSAAVSLLATLAALLAFLFFLGSYTFIPTAAAASLKAVPVAQQAAWIAANTKVVTGLGYASFVATDPAMRSAVISGSTYVFVFGLVCAFASALVQRRSAGA
jgi:hypothetical protein